MQKLNINKIDLSSYIKLMGINLFSAGIPIGIIMFIMSLLGVNVHLYLSNTHFYGIYAGILGLFVVPIAAGILGLILGLISFLPFTFILKFTYGIKLSLEIKNKIIED